MWIDVYCANHLCNDERQNSRKGLKRQKTKEHEQNGYKLHRAVADLFRAESDWECLADNLDCAEENEREGFCMFVVVGKGCRG